MTAAVIAAVAALLVGVLGALLSYVNARRLSRTEAQLARVNAQLSELYGPMHATLEATRIAYEKFVRSSRNSPNFFNPKLPKPTDEELELWRAWVTTVLQPGNRRTYELIVNKAHLLIDDEMPECLLTFCAHVAGFDVTIRRWEAGDYSRHLSVVSHPRDALNSYARDSFRQLKLTQAQLLAQSKINPNAKGQAVRP
jgi:hypothetical protein